jgi:hypothetical protein
MRWYVIEAIRGARSRPGFALVLVVVSASLAAASLAYANTERARVRDQAQAVQVDDWYVVTFADLAGERLTAADLDTVCQLESVEWAAGMLPAEDAEFPNSDRTATVRGVRGCNLGRIGIPVEPGRSFAPVGLIEVFPLGAVPGTPSAMVSGSHGQFTLLEQAGLPETLLGSSPTEGLVVLPPAASGAPADITTIRIGTRSLDVASSLAGTVPTVLRDDDELAIRVTPTADQFAAQRSYLAGLDQASAAATVGIVALAALLSTALLFITTRLRAREYARRRTLGCRRLPLAAQVITEAMLCTAVGAAIGTAGVVMWLRASGVLSLSPSLLVAVPAVTVAATGLFSIPLAVWVGAKDPIVVLRVP